jgi:hypothetical protein
MVAPAEAHAQKHHCPVNVKKWQQPNSSDTLTYKNLKISKMVKNIREI